MSYGHTPALHLSEEPNFGFSPLKRCKMDDLPVQRTVKAYMHWLIGQAQEAGRVNEAIGIQVSLGEMESFRRGVLHAAITLRVEIGTRYDKPERTLWIFTKARSLRCVRGPRPAGNENGGLLQRDRTPESGVAAGINQAQPDRAGERG